VGYTAETRQQVIVKQGAPIGDVILIAAFLLRSGGSSAGA